MSGPDFDELPLKVRDYIFKLEQENALLNNEKAILQEELKLALLRKYGNSSEKSDEKQPLLFDESAEELEDAPELSEETVEVKSHTKKSPGRKPLSPEIPREEIIHDIPEEEKTCGCGCTLSKIDEEVSERLQIIPAKVFVERHIRPKYACRNCEGSGDEEKPVFRVAPAPPSILPGSIATPGLLAFVWGNKFLDHLPFNRQEKRFERIGVSLSRQVMSSWTNKIAPKLSPLIDLMKKHLKSGEYIQMDETPVQVHREVNRSDTTKSYMWLARGGPPDKPILIYEYQKTRSSQYPKAFLEGFSGFLQTDGYQSYDSALKGNMEITHVGCLAHVRRKFHEAAKIKKKKGTAWEALEKIKVFYRVEKELREQDLSAQDFLEQRKAKLTDHIKEFTAWLEEKGASIPPSTPTGKAISYALGQWPKVKNYLECADLTPDTNLAENAIRPFVIGRKNWLFSGSPEGAAASCVVYSLFESAKANSLNPFGYMKMVLLDFEANGTQTNWENLLPWMVSKQKVRELGVYRPKN
jgi:transposase